MDWRSDSNRNIVLPSNCECGVANVRAAREHHGVLMCGISVSVLFATVASARPTAMRDLRIDRLAGPLNRLWARELIQTGARG